jgi:competence protein ComEA
LKEKTHNELAIPDSGWDAPSRGLAILIGASLLASGVAQFTTIRRAEPLVERRIFVYEDVGVIAPTVVVRGKVNVNVDPIDVLVRLPGIGEALARRIIAYRTEHGPFVSLDDLVGVSGIGPATVEGLRDKACVTPDQ